MPFENGITISQSGLIFLLGLFLTKKESEGLRAQIKGFKAKTRDIEDEYPNMKSNSLKYMATHWVFSYLSFKGIKNQLITGYDKETLLLQIADELSKVPDAVYKALPREVQESFVEDINEYIKEGNEVHSPYESIVVHPVIRKRYENKFNYFALRYLDEFVEFPSLRFQIYIGNYVHDRREKDIAGTLLYTERIIKEKINVFSRLSDVCKLKDNALLLKNTEESVGWEKFPNPSYNIEEGNIMIYLKMDDVLKMRIDNYRTIRNRTEKRTRRGEKRIEKYKIVGEIGGKNSINYSEPIALFSLNELPALLHELLIKRTTPAEIEKQICQHIERQFNKLENYQAGDQLPISQIPSKLLKSSTKYSINTKKLLSEINKEIDVTHQKINLIKNNREEIGKSKKGNPTRKQIFNNRELGEEATWITYDLLRLMPIGNRENWKGYQHSQLQQSLAFYDSRPREAFAILNSTWNFDDDTYLWNQQIKKIFNEKSFESFYEKYLRLRLNIYSTVLSALKSSMENDKIFNKALKQYHVWNLFKEREFSIDTTNNLKEKLLAKPIALARGIFDEKPTFRYGVNIHEQPETFADWYRYATCSQEKYQSFYDYKRDYRELYILDQSKPDKEQKKSVEKLRLENDLYIKKLKMQDLFLKAIVEELYEQVFDNKMTFALKGFYLDREERLEQIRMADKQKCRKKGDKSENIIKETFIWNRTVPYKHGAIEEDVIKLKDLGKFKRLLADPKTEHILQYMPDRKWRKIELENELESYEKIRREQLLKLIQVFESDILKKCGYDGLNHFDYLERNGDPHFKYYVTNGLLKGHEGVSETDIEWLSGINEKTFESEPVIDELKQKPIIIQESFMLIYIRNKIAHNQMLCPLLFAFMLYLCDDRVSDNETYSETVLRSLNKIISHLLE